MTGHGKPPAKYSRRAEEPAEIAYSAEAEQPARRGYRQIVVEEASRRLTTSTARIVLSEDNNHAVMASYEYR